MVASSDVSNPKSVRSGSEAWVIRLGAWGGVVGSLLAMIGNLLHPATPEHDPLGVARTIAESGIWVPVHLVIVVGLILMLGGLVGISRSVVGGLPGALSQLGMWAGVAGIAVGVILVIVDGVAAKHLADAWQEAPAAEAPVALRVVVAEESINFALAALFNILFAGVTFMLLGLAVALSGEHPRGPAWVVVLAGVLSIPVALVQAYQGESVAFTRVATIIHPHGHHAVGDMDERATAPHTRCGGEPSGRRGWEHHMNVEGADRQSASARCSRVPWSQRGPATVAVYDRRAPYTVSVGIAFINAYACMCFHGLRAIYDASIRSREGPRVAPNHEEQPS